MHEVKSSFRGVSPINAVLDRIVERGLEFGGLRSTFVPTSAGDIAVYESRGRGRGPTIALIPDRSIRTVHHMPLLSSLAPHVRKILIVDPPAQGLSRVTEAQVSTAVIFQGIVEALSTMLRGEPVVLFGTSFGAMHAIRYALKFPKNVLGIVLTEPFGAPEAEIERQSLRRSSSELWNSAVVDRQALHALDAFQNVRQLLLHKSRYQREDLLAAEEVRALKKPTLLVVSGRESRLPSNNLEFFYTTLPDTARVVFVDSAKPVVDSPNVVSQLVRSFLGELGEVPEEHAPRATKRAPGPKGNPLFGSLKDYQRLGLLPFYEGVWRQYGDTVRVRMGPIVQHLFVKPADALQILQDKHENFIKGLGVRKFRLLLGEGLLTSDGEQWKKQRHYAHPLFTPQSTQANAGAVFDAVDELISECATAAETRTPLDVGKAGKSFATTFIMRAMFRAKRDERTTAVSQAFEEGLDYVVKQSIKIVDVPRWVPTEPNRRMNHTMRVLNRFIDEMIAEHKDGDGTDFLSMLLRATDKKSGSPMSKNEIHSQILTIFAAGHDTTGSALQWILYELCLNREAQRRVVDEVERVIGDGQLSLARVAELTYVSQVVEESLRLHPPVPILTRQPLRDEVVGGVLIKPGSMVLVSPQLTQRHPEYWPDPDRFDPDRFSAEGSKNIVRGAFMPFALGQRICAGRSLAMLELTSAVAAISLRFDLSLRSKEPITHHPVFPILRPNKPIVIDFKHRR